LPQIEALIEEHELLKRILRHRSGEDEVAAIGELGKAIADISFGKSMTVYEEYLELLHAA
jgi:hypothetical protein